MVKKVTSKPVTRSDGRASKQAILDAALIIILRDGIRAVKHKTVAEVAGVTQSSTAYYFKDIQQLITEAFLYHLEGYQQQMNAARRIGHVILDGHRGRDWSEEAVKKAIVEDHLQALMMIIATDTEEAVTYMLLDRIFRNETLQNPDLYGALRQQDQKDIDAMTDFYRELDCENPEECAAHTLAVLWFLGERLLQNRYAEAEKDYAKKMLRSILLKNMGLSS